ncbi:four helix bundle protein [Aquimarina sp. Aq78]|uniref:four helix bundle protein n=1 Tax=Aquimarina sp. Aq78 TaxID=1191889 RepID=UPI000D10C8D4|nr:four helix bundle protein [Aquimarina sp. Aq78]
MATIKRFEDLEIWQEARRLSKEIILLSKTTGLENDYKLKDQIKGSSGSVMDNIAEGFERDGNIEFRQFLSIAKASSGETRSQLYRIFDSGYIEEKALKILVNDYETLSRRISGFISYLNKKEFRGVKYKES